MRQKDAEITSHVFLGKHLLLTAVWAPATAATCESRYYKLAGKLFFCHLFFYKCSHMKPLGADIRHRIIQLRQKKMAIVAISERLLISKSAVGSILKQYNVSKTLSTNYKGKCGRKPKLSAIDRRAMYRATVRNPNATAREIQQTVGGRLLTLSIRSVQRNLNKIGRLAYRPKKSPIWSRRQRAIRYQWCLCQLHSDAKNLQRTIYSDETYVDLNSGPKTQYVRRGKLEKIRLQHCISHRSFVRRILLWGCISIDGVGPLVVLRGTMTASKYSKILQDHIIPFKEMIFSLQHDNAPSHKAAEVQKLLKNNDITTMDWPPYSPDLNPIENVWSVLKRKLNAHVFMTLDELETRAIDIWYHDEEIRQTCVSAIQSMPERLQSCAKSRGGYVKY